MSGLHLIADLAACSGRLALDRLADLNEACVAAVDACGMRRVGELFVPFFGADRQPLGVTGVVLLAESHLAVHTWPESAKVAIDVYVCNQETDNRLRAEDLLSRLIAAFEPGETRIERVSRS